MKKVVVTGATSFIGVHLIQKLLEQEVIIYAVIRPASTNISRLPRGERVHIIEAELGDLKQIKNLLISADIFYHLAWEGARTPYRDDEQIQKRNYECAVLAMETAVELGCTLFIGSGSQAEYGKICGKVDESYPCHPITEYGKYKYKACCELGAMAKKAGMRFVWTRIFSVYGNYDYPGTLIMSCLSKMKDNMPVKMTECVQKWDFVYVEDVAEAMMRFMSVVCEDGVYNVASGSSRRLKEFVEELKYILKSDSVIEYGAIPYGKEGSVSFEPIVTKLERALNWKAETTFDKGIRKILSQF